MANNDDLEKNKGTLQAMVAFGCDREMAAKGVGWTVPELNQVLRDDPAFAQTLLRAEGQAEFHRMRLLHEVTKEEKNWRAATWWLERRGQRRYSTRHAKRVTTADIQEFIGVLVDMVFADVTREFDRERLVTSLLALARAWDEDMREMREMVPVEISDTETIEGGQS
jgi:hypothetical protein